MSQLTGTLKDRGLDGRSQGEEDISSETPQPYVSRAAASASRRIFDAGPTYIAPTPRLCFYGISYELMELLVPPPEFASWYVEAYWSRVHPIARVLHRPWFEKRYETFCNDLENGRESPYSLQSLVFAVMFSGVLAIPNEIHPEKTLWVGKLQDAVEDCLARANVIRTTNIETLQAFVVYLVRYQLPSNAVHFLHIGRSLLAWLHKTLNCHYNLFQSNMFSIRYQSVSSL